MGVLPRHTSPPPRPAASSDAREQSRILRVRAAEVVALNRATAERLRSVIAASAAIVAAVDGARRRSEVIEVEGGGRIDLATLLITDSAGRRRVLTPTEWRLLRALHRARGQVVSRSELAEQLWGHRVDRDSALEVYISRVRRKLGGSRAGIETVRGIGYRLRIGVNPGAEPLHRQERPA